MEGRDVATINTGQGSKTTANPMQDSTLYFAYGSNLSTTQMLERCPTTRPVGLAYLHGWKWLINERGYANIVQVPHSKPGVGSRDASSSPQQDTPPNVAGIPEEKLPGVFGLLYNILPDDEAFLDVCEGVPLAYQKEVMEVEVVERTADRADSEEEGEGQEVEGKVFVQALIYIDNARITPSAPKPEYVLRMNRGIDEAESGWQLPRWYVDAVMRRYIPPQE
jgi:gamma-glutamylcyclotransferase